MTELLAFSLALYYGAGTVVTVYQLKRLLNDNWSFIAAVPAAFVAGVFWPGALALMFTEK
jgi:hypothetical protein